MKKIKYVNIKDILAIFKLFLALPCAVAFKLKHKDLWLVCERENDARDNGYWFFRHICIKYPEQEIAYAINKDCVDYYKVRNIGKVIQYGSFVHWIYYLAASRNISSQKGGKPNAAICYFLEVYLGRRKNRVFLQHGIIKDDLKWLYYDVTKVPLFTCSVKREYDYVMKKFGYPKEAVQLVGLCRYDNLLTEHKIRKQILVMPTWREWLGHLTANVSAEEAEQAFLSSEYYSVWLSFIQNQELSDILAKYDYQLLFFLHSNMQKYNNCFVTNSERMVVADNTSYDVQQLLMESEVLVTDYSSIFFDFAYMKKPLFYYQFDYEIFRQSHYQEGYFSYSNDGFGEVISDEKNLICVLEKSILAKCKMSTKYIERVNGFFTFRDDQNCERTYQAIKKMNI